MLIIALAARGFSQFSGFLLASNTNTSNSDSVDHANTSNEFLRTPKRFLGKPIHVTLHYICYQVNEFLSTQDEGAKKEPMSVEQVAMGFITVANETMCRPIRALTEARGHDTARHVLACFGGAGGQHACSIARSLGMSTVFIHR